MDTVPNTPPPSELLTQVLLTAVAASNPVGGCMQIHSSQPVWHRVLRRECNSWSGSWHVAQNQLKAAAADMHTTALVAAGSGGVHKQHVLASAEAAAAAAAVAAAVAAEDSLARVLA